MNSISIKQEELTHYNDVCKRLKSYKVNDVLGKQGFCYYTTLETFNKIRNNNWIWISNVAKMNDKDEFIGDDNLNNNKEFYHLLCLSNGDEESIPMWYMYGGMDGCGVRIRFTPSVIKILLEDITLYKISSIKKNGEYKARLMDKKEYTVRAGWVYYKNNKHSDNCYKLNRKTYLITDYNPSGFYKSNTFIKSHYWEYEKEFRIVIHNRSGQAYQYIALDLNEVYNRLTFMFGPQLKNYCQLEDYPNIIEYNNSRYKKSQLNVIMKQSVVNQCK